MPTHSNTTFQLPLVPMVKIIAATSSCHSIPAHICHHRHCLVLIMEQHFADVTITQVHLGELFPLGIS